MRLIWYDIVKYYWCQRPVIFINVTLRNFRVMSFLCSVDPLTNIFIKISYKFYAFHVKHNI